MFKQGIGQKIKNLIIIVTIFVLPMYFFKNKHSKKKWLDKKVKYKNLMLIEN